MIDVEEAKAVAERLLRDQLPRRWAHTQGVGERAHELWGVLGERTPVVEVAAWLHDIGYSSVVRSTGFHPLDGARYLRDVLVVDDMVCRLVAHHTGALVEADERGISDLADEFSLPDPDLLDALTYCDVTTDPDGCRVEVEERLSEIMMRYSSTHVVHRAVARSAPLLRKSAFNIRRRLGD
ncbi:HD domain-containing protein [Kribbella albertanoniae]|uniref:HD domain-containing protein n=1 Tax=Kribbella albertanoniae TaxID=1266829 RepID=UPI001EDF13DC|nr:HD domain-containing protein [Kribbella albertanoniae]